ncbi:MAG: helix-turn-helix domain-containing protein [Solirubrobacteraceae bacterium]
MIEIALGVEDLASTRFAISPLTETVTSLWALTDPGRHALHLPWRRAAWAALTEVDTRLLVSLVGPARADPGFVSGPSRALPDFLTLRPRTFAPRFDDELAAVRATPPAVVRRDLTATHAPDPVPAILRDRPAAGLRDEICDQLARYWRRALAPGWADMRLVLEADTTYRARQLTTGGADALFADIHPNVSFRDGVLSIREMISRHTVSAAGRGLLLIPSIFAYKPVPPLDPGQPPSLIYPSRGVATLWHPPSPPDRTAIASLIGPPRARLLAMLSEPLATTEIARRLRVTPSAVSQHLKILRAAGLTTCARHGRQVLHRRSALGDRLLDGPDAA